MSIFVGATPPAVEEVEVTVFGPGYGESVAVHLGQGDWLIVDSCREGPKKPPAAKEYLEAIGVLPEQVKYLLVSHWHDDHTKGISELADYYSTARIGVSNVLNTQEGKTFLAAYSGKVSELSRGTAELYNIFSQHKPRLEPLSQNRMVLERQGGIPVRVTALSPTDEFFFEARAILQRYMPAPGNAPLKEAPNLSPNNEAVVIHIAVGRVAILLGSDLETSHFGWTVLTKNPHIAQLPKADFYKVAHHGSETAECPTIWAQLLAAKPTCVMTPFNHGRHRLPNETDRKRILANSSAAHISSLASTKSTIDPRILRRLETLGSRPIPLNAGFGAVRSRKLVDAPTAWSILHYGQAGRLQG